MHISKQSILVVAALAVQWTAGQSLSNLPDCAKPVIVDGISSTGCELTDYTCICKSTSFIGRIQSQIKSACSTSDQAATLNFAKQICSAAGESLSLPDASDSGSSKPAPSAAAAPAPEASADTASAPAVDSASGTSSETASAPTVSPPYPVANGTSGGVNGTNSTTPFLGAAVVGRSSCMVSLVVLPVLGLAGIYFL